MICVQTLKIQCFFPFVRRSAAIIVFLVSSFHCLLSGFTNDHKTKTKTTTFDVKNGPCETRPFFSFSPFPVLFPFSSFTLPFPSPFLFPFSFSFLFYFPFLFLFLFFSFRFSFAFPFSFLFLSLSLSYSFLSLPLLFLFLFLFPFLAHVNPLVKVFLASTWKNDKRKKKTTTCEKTIWKGSGFLQDPVKTHQIGSDPIWLMKRICTRISALHNYL